MRFLMLNWRDPKNPLAGGAERVTLAYLSALARRGHDVFWFANHFSGAEPSEQIDGVTIRSNHTQQPSVVVRQDIVTRWGNSADQLMAALLEYSRAPIAAANFSRMDRSWHPFSEDERDRIERLLLGEQPPA